MPKTQRILFIILASTVFIYLAIRSYTVCIVHDEAASFFNYIRSGIFFPFMENYHVSANNHILNSLLSWISYKLLGTDEWTIRLPNLLSFLVYAWAIFHLGKRINTTYLRWYFYILLLGSHYLIEFFAYSRGYGMGTAFLAASVLFLTRFSEENGQNYKPIYLGIICLGLATLANLNLLVSFLIWGLLALLIIIKNYPSLSLKALIGPVVLYLSILAVFIVWSFELRGHSELYFGNSKMLFTLFSLIAPFSFVNPHQYYPVFVAFIGLISFAGIAIFFKNRKESISTFQIFLLLFTLNVAGLFTLHHLMDVVYPSARTALHLYFLFAAMVPFTIQQFKPKIKTTLTVLSLLIFVPVLAYSLSSVNTYQSASPDWQMEQISDEFYPTIIELNEGREFPYSMQTSPGFYTKILAFQDFQQGTKLAMWDDFLGDFPLYIADLALVDTAVFPEFNLYYHEVLYDQYSKMGLYQRNHLMQSFPIVDSTFVQSDFSKEGFTSLLITPVPDSLIGKPFRVDYELTSTSPNAPMPTAVTLELRDSINNMTWYKQQRIDYHYDQAGGDTVRLSFINDKMPDHTVLLRSFFWNLNGEEFKIDYSKTVFSLLKEDSSH